MPNSKTIVEEYLSGKDWRVKENSNSIFSFGGLNKYLSGEVSKDYWLRSVYPEYISKEYVDGAMHIHDLGGLSIYCCGYSLQTILMKGVRGVPNIPTSKPAKHFDSVLNQISNLITVFQNEIMGAVALNSFDTLLAPFIKKDCLKYEDIKQSMQNFLFSINSNSRAGSEPAFSNLTFDLTPPEDLLDEYAIIGGELESFTYRKCQQEMDLLNKVFFELMLEGDSEGKLFAYPIPTYNIHSRFDWDNPNNKLLWEMAGKYGTPYFANFLNSDLDVKDIRSMCPMTSDTEVLVKSNEGIRIAKISHIYNCNKQNETKYSVWTNNGWKPASVIKTPKTKTYDIRLSNGTNVKFGENHLQPIEGGSVLKASELKVGMWVPFNKKEICGENGCTELGYAVGAYIGDGSRIGGGIVYSLCAFEKDDETEKRLTKFWNDIGFSTTISYGNRNVRFVKVNGNPYDTIKRYVDGNNALTKSLTNEVFKLSTEFKRGLIEGFRATDGCRDRKRLYTSSDKLRNDTQRLFSSLGEKCLINYEDSRDGRLGENINYRVDYPSRESYGNLYKEDENYNYYQITNIENYEYGGDYLYCFEVDNDDHLFMLANGLITHNCRLSLNLNELRKKNGGLFGAGDSTGSIGVVTINLPRIGYESKTEEEFFSRLDYLMTVAKDSLEIKRAWLQENIIKTNAIPAFMEYVGTIDNHFSTIGDIGKNEMCLNFLGKDILSDEGKRFAEKVGDFFRNKLIAFQEETGHLYNYEASPSESTCYRLAKKDKETYPEIITQGEGKDIYYTNSCHIPVKLIESIDKTFSHQDSLQTQYTGGTVIHIYLDGAITGEQAKSVIKNVCYNYRTPYVSLSPISRYCDEHGYVKEIVDKCPICKKRLKKYQRITGYLRCIDNFNKGKAQEFKDRAQLSSTKLGE